MIAVQHSYLALWAEAHLPFSSHWLIMLLISPSGGIIVTREEGGGLRQKENPLQGRELSRRRERKIQRMYKMRKGHIAVFWNVNSQSSWGQWNGTPRHVSSSLPVGIWRVESSGTSWTFDEMAEACTPLKRQSVREAGKKKEKKWEEGEERRHPGGRRGRKAHFRWGGQ